MICINLINILDKNKADYLNSKGFSYLIKRIDKKTVYQFVGTEEFLKVLNSNYDKGSFFIQKYMNF